MAHTARCAVIGGANIDIGGFPEAALAMGDSIPGRVRMSAGGVGRNIACNLARLGVETHLLTALGGDALAELIRADCLCAGVRLDCALTFEGAGSNVYLFIADGGGNMKLAVNDMALCASLTPEALAPRLELLNGMDAVILDANLPEATLNWLCENLKVPLIADAVSAAKVGRLRGALPHLRVLKPNALEASALIDEPVYDVITAKLAAEKLLATGVKRVFITLGERGVCCAEAGQTRFVAAVPARVVNTTGAGDAFTAALAWAELRGFDLADCARAGVAAAALATESAETVNPAINAEAVLNRMD